ncbi:hypothetical protein ACF0H5_012490 [Mactra antiquata]
MEGDIKISAVFSLTDELSGEGKSKPDVSTDVHCLTTESHHGDLATENGDTSTNSVNYDGSATDESPPILIPMASNSFTPKRCPRAVANSSPPVLELEEMKSDVASNYPILPPVDPRRGVEDKTPTPKKICRRIAPSYIVLKRIDKHLINGSSTSVRLFKRRFSDCTNMCKKIQFMRRLKSGKDVFDVMTPSKLTTSGLYLDVEKNKSNNKNKKSNIKPKNVSNGNQMKRVHRKIRKLPNDFRSWQSFIKKSFAAEEESDLTDNDRSNVENWQKHVCDAFLLRNQILIKRSHNKKVKLLKLRSKPDMDMPSILKNEVKSNVSGRVCKPNTKYLADFLLNRNEFLEQKHVFQTNNQLRRLVNQSNILKEKGGKSSSNDKRPASKKRKPTPDIVIENLEGNCVTTYNKTPDLLRKKLKKSVSKQMTDTHTRAQRKDAQQKSFVSNNAGKDGVIIQEMPNEQSVIAELLQSKSPSSMLSINSKTSVFGERANAPAISSSSTSKELATSSVVKVVKSIQPKLAGLTTIGIRSGVSLNSVTSSSKSPPNIETNKVLITSPSSNTSSHLVTNQYGVTYLFHHKAPDGNVPIIKLLPPVTSSLNNTATHDVLQKSYGNLKSLVPSSVSTLLSQSSLKSAQSIASEVNPRREEPKVFEPSVINTSDGLKTGLSSQKLSLSPIKMTNTTTISNISSPNVKTTWQNIAPSVTKCAKVPMTQSTFPGFSILPQNLNGNVFNGTPQQPVIKSTLSVVSAASSQVLFSVPSNGAVPIASPSSNSHVAAGNVKSVIPNKGKFYLLKIDGKNVLIPTDGVTLQSNTANDMSIGTTRTTPTALVDSNKCLSANRKPTLAAGQSLKVVFPQSSSSSPPIKIKQEPIDDWSEHLFNSTTSVSNIPVPTSTKVMEPTASIVNVRERLSAKLNETITKKGIGNTYQGHVLVLNKNNDYTARSYATTIQPINPKPTAINIDDSTNMPNVPSPKTETSKTDEITHSSIPKEVKPIPFTEALSAREEKLRKLKELLKEKQKAVEAIRNTK